MTMIGMLNAIQSLLVLCIANSVHLDRALEIQPNIFHTLSAKEEKKTNQNGIFSIRLQFSFIVTPAKCFPYSLYALQNACRLIFLETGNTVYQSHRLQLYEIDNN